MQLYGTGLRMENDCNLFGFYRRKKNGLFALESNNNRFEAKWQDKERKCMWRNVEILYSQYFHCSLCFFFHSFIFLSFNLISLLEMDCASHFAY